MEAAVRATHTRRRDQRRRLAWLAAISASYAVDAAFLAGFAAAGTLGWGIPAFYAGAALVICGGVWLLTASDANLRFRDPSLPATQVGLAVALQIATVAMAPQIAFPQLANLFVIFAFGMTSMPLRRSTLVWTAGIAAIGLLVYAEGGRLAVPVATPLERALVWAYFSAILARCLGLGWQMNELQRRLADGRRQLGQSLEQMRQLASHDELTRTLNRRSLIEHLEQARSRAERGGEGFSVALLDLDHFKDINDTHGHAVGDDVLRAFSKMAYRGLRDSDAFGRYGGEEFMLILGATAPAAAQAAVERLRNNVGARDWSEFAPELQVTVSAGVTGYRRGETVSQLLSRADGALYESKRAGRDRVTVKE